MSIIADLDVKPSVTLLGGIILENSRVSISPIRDVLSIEIHNCISSLEVMTDKAEDIADYIIMLTVAKKV